MLRRYPEWGNDTKLIKQISEQKEIAPTEWSGSCTIINKLQMIQLDSLRTTYHCIIIFINRGLNNSPSFNCVLPFRSLWDVMVNLFLYPGRPR